MAAGDYKDCDKCGGKTFQDYGLDYDWADKNGNDFYGDKIKLVRGTNYSLHNLGDWTVLCQECAKTHKIIIVPITEGTHHE
jgi:hypothetical protein